MRRTGVASLPLHYGKAPQWLVKRMIKLSGEIVTIIIDEYGREEFLRRVSDPFWFQAFGCALGYDWHSSGLTTVVTGVLKSSIIPEEHGVAVCGGKGKISLQTPMEISKIGEKFNLSSAKINHLQYASRMSAKVDNTAIQAGYPLYHHAFFLDENGNWAVIQQGMNIRDRTARRYHWLSRNVKSFVSEPHNAIVGEEKREIVLNMTAKESEGCRKTSTDIARENPRKIMKMLKSIRPACQKSLQEWISRTEEKEYVVDVLSLPRNLNWKTVRKMYEFQPRNYEELLGIRGVGPATVRALALISELIYGEKPSWRDPVKYSFCVGGKDGVPFPVNRKAYDEAIEILENAIKQAKVGDEERMKAIRRLSEFLNR